MSLDDEWDAAQPPEGTPLRELAASKRLPQRRALLIIRQVLEALAVVHAAGKIHGDVNPGTIFVIARLDKDRVNLGERGKPGDPVYCAPEPVLGSSDARADLYAVGAVLFELLTGRPPFFADDPTALRRLHAYAPVQTLKQRAPELSFADSLETVVATALAKKSGDRFRTAADMIEAVDRALAETTDAAPAPPPRGSSDGFDASLLQLAQDLVRKVPPADDAANVPLVPNNVSREVPELPWATRARAVVSRVLDRLSSRLRISRRTLVGGLATVLAVGLIVAVGMCTASSENSKQPAAVVARESGTARAMQTTSLDDRCVQLAKACGHTDKHVARIIAQCKQAAKTQVEQGCTDTAIAAYDCYETRLCGKADNVWALDDLRILSARHATCVAEGDAVRACVGSD